MKMVGNTTQLIELSSNELVKCNEEKQRNLEGRSIRKLTTEQTEAALFAAVSTGSLDAVKEFFSEGEIYFSIGSRVVSEAVEKAAARGDLDIVRYLMPYEQKISITYREMVLCSDVEILLMNGPIGNLTRDYARKLATGE